MYKSKVLVVFTVLVYVLFIVFQFSDSEDIARNLSLIILPLITVAYFLYVRRKTLFFSLFLTFYSISDLMGLITDYIPYDIEYFLGNSLYIFAYIFLFLEVCKSVSFNHVVREFKLHIITLTILNIYIVYVLQVIVDPYLSLTIEYFLELIYNISMLMVLSVSLLNYFYRDNKKSLLLFIGALCIVFSEVISIAYMYITDKSLLNVISVTLYVLAFYFFFQQSKLKNVESADAITE